MALKKVFNREIKIAYRGMNLSLVHEIKRLTKILTCSNDLIRGF